MGSLRIGLDIDGVIYPWHWSLYRYFTEFKGFTGDERAFWTMIKSMPYGSIEYFVSLPTLYLDTSPTSDVLINLPKIAELGEIFYITARTDELRWATGKFFDNYRLPFKENIIFSKDKANYVRLNKIDCFLDDQPNNLDALKGVTETYLFKAVHNWMDRERFPLINNMREFYELLRSRV